MAALVERLRAIRDKRTTTPADGRVITEAMTALAPSPQADKARGEHDWSGDGEHCAKCGDPDWCAGPVCNGRTTPQPQGDASPESATARVVVNNRPATHYCRQCGALWSDFGTYWSLVSAACGKCCDNQPMGEQIAAIPSHASSAEMQAVIRARAFMARDGASESEGDAFAAGWTDCESHRAQQPVATPQVWKSIDLLNTNTDDLFWFLRGDTVDGPRPPQHGGYDSDEWDYFAPAEHPPLAALSTPQARPDGGDSDEEENPDSFSDWLAREMPAGTIIGNPRWWAPRIARAYKYTHPAPAPDVALPLVDVLRIPAQQSLDPITAYFEDYSPGQGRITVACYGDAWTASWGAMGDRTVREFVASVDAGYLSGAFLQLCGGNGRHRDYTDRIARAVLAALTAAQQEAGQ